MCQCWWNRRTREIISISRPPRGTIFHLTNRRCNIGRTDPAYAGTVIVVALSCSLFVNMLTCCSGKNCSRLYSFTTIIFSRSSFSFLFHDLREWAYSLDHGMELRDECYTSKKLVYFDFSCLRFYHVFRSFSLDLDS